MLAGPVKSNADTTQKLREAQEALVLGGFVARELVAFFHVEILKDRMALEIPKGWRDSSNWDGIKFEARLREDGVPCIVIKYKGDLDVKRIREIDPFHRGPMEGKVPFETEYAFRFEQSSRSLFLVDHAQVPQSTWSTDPPRYYYRRIQVNSDWHLHFTHYFDWLGTVTGKTVNKNFVHSLEGKASGGTTIMSEDDDFRYQIGMAKRRY